MVIDLSAPFPAHVVEAYDMLSVSPIVAEASREGEPAVFIIAQLQNLSEGLCGSTCLGKLYGKPTFIDLALRQSKPIGLIDIQQADPASI